MKLPVNRNVKKIKIILLTPSPDQNVKITEPGNELEKHAAQIRSLANQYGIGLADSYEAFRQITASDNPRPRSSVKENSFMILEIKTL